MVNNGCKTGFYGVANFLDKVEDVFTYEYVAWNVSHLSKKELIYKHHKSTFSITPEIFVELTKYADVIKCFHNWFIETWRKKRTLILQDPLVIQRRHAYGDLYKKILL
jgi:hypothetical protein